MAHTYNISLLPSLQEQVAFYNTLNMQLRTHAHDSYQNFLDFIDSKSEQLADRPEYESLQQVFELASDRMEALLTALDQEQEHIDYWTKQLAAVETSQDQIHWQDIASELIEGGDYRKDAQEFKTWLSADVAGLQQELTELLDDWRACVEEGEVAELAYLLEALAEDDQSLSKNSGRQASDPMDELFGDQPSPEGGDWQADNEQDDDNQSRPDGCCGRQTPCCQTQSSPKDYGGQADSADGQTRGGCCKE